MKSFYFSSLTSARSTHEGGQVNYRHNEELILPPSMSWCLSDMCYPETGITGRKKEEGLDG